MSASRPDRDEVIRAELDAYRDETRAYREETKAFRDQTAAQFERLNARFDRVEAHMERRDRDIATIVEIVMELRDRLNGDGEGDAT